MTNSSDFNPFPKSYISEMEATLRHLDSAIGSHMRSMDKALAKINGVKRAAAKATTLEKTSVSLSQILLSSLAGRSAGGTRQAQSQSLGATLATDVIKASRGQVMSQLASAISRAMDRDL